MFGQQVTFSFERQRAMLEENEVTRGLVGKYVDLYAFADGRFQVRWKGVTQPCTLFDSAQRVTQLPLPRASDSAMSLPLSRSDRISFCHPPR